VISQVIRSPRPISLPDFSSFPYLHPFDDDRDDDKERHSAMGQADQRRNPPDSPIGQLLKHLGMTREDLQRHSSQMREFLTTESTPSSLPEDNTEPAKPGVDGQPLAPTKIQSLLARERVWYPADTRQVTAQLLDCTSQIRWRPSSSDRTSLRGRKSAVGGTATPWVHLHPPLSRPPCRPDPPPPPHAMPSVNLSSQESETQVGYFSCYKRYAPLT
jgi:hypothetical protein